ncbi:MAG: hypothetical protein AAB676_07135 [Verrucomicrobiota bacterium]
MQLRCGKSSPRANEKGYALMLVLFFSGISLLVLNSSLDWTASNARFTERSNQYYTTLYAAEAATEKALARMITDYHTGGESVLYNGLDLYRNLAPTPAENPIWSEFEFNNAQGGEGKTYVERTISQSYQPLNSQYAGLNGFVSTYRIISNARRLNSPQEITAAVQQDVQVASIPVFQFAIFYGSLLEFTWAAPLTVRGRVHGNGSVYTGSSAPLTFFQDITSVGINQKKDWMGHTMSQYTGTITFYGRKETNTATLTLPIGTNNTPAAVHAVIEIPPASEPITSPMGKQRYYNKAELLILVSNSTVTVSAKTPAFSSSSTSIPWTNASYFVTTNKTFTDQREGKTIKTTELDVGKFITWSATNTTVDSVLGDGNSPNLIYVADQRSTTSSQLAGVRLINGQTLPSRGLTVSTPNPLYVKGHFNQPTAAYLGTTNTSNAKPASLVSDALTLLSSAWDDSLSGGSFTSRDAVNTTVNAALLTGIVPSGGSGGTSPMSGGVVNLPRLLEDWGNGARILTLNGSIVNLFFSTKATAPFQNPGNYYYAPTRAFNFDMNYLDITKQPPGTPELDVLIRGQWVTPPPNTTDYAGN